MRGLERVPVVTGVVFALTAAGAVAQALDPGLLQAWQRNPDGLHGDWWRTGSALFVQDGGIVGALSNLGFLLVIGAIVEQFLAPWQWLTCYFGAALCGALAGYGWQPVGAGNSIAVCGLAGALAVALWARTPGAVRAAPIALLYWCGALLATAWWPGLFAGLAAGALAHLAWARGRDPRRPAAAAAPVTAAILLAAANIHGAALAAGLLIAAGLRLAADSVAERPGTRYS
jgi:membrane associated rhomboid family serine protease